MFRVKICGITNVDDAMLAVQAGADAIGLNFYPKSSRFCSAEAARKIGDAVPCGVCKVGLFINASPDEIRETVHRLELDLVQLHGDEPPEVLGQLRGIPVMRGLRPGTDFAPVAEYLQRCHRLTCMPRMILIDACVPGQYGGTGTTADWLALSAARWQLAGLPLVLAGGLKPDNVDHAIAAVRPWAVDVASGVEQSATKKSDALVREFVHRAKAALARAATTR
jgi:phosphoribosylanthranilate isomerase